VNPYLDRLHEWWDATMSDEQEYRSPEWWAAKWLELRWIAQRETVEGFTL